MKMITLAAALALTVLMGGLSSASAESGTTQPAGTAAMGPTSRPTTMPAGQPAKLAAPIELNRTGGFVGTNDALKIAVDGSYTSTGRLAGEHQGKLGADALAALAKAVELAKLPANAHYKAPAGVADGFQFVLRVGDCTVKWEDMAVMPERLTPLVNQLDRIMANLAGQPPPAPLQ